MAPSLGPGWTEGKPTAGWKDTKKAGISTTLCKKHGLYTTPSARGNVQNFQAAGVRHPTCNGSGGERIAGNEGHTEKTDHELDTRMVQSTYLLGMRDN